MRVSDDNATQRSDESTSDEAASKSVVRRLAMRIERDCDDGQYAFGTRALDRAALGQGDLSALMMEGSDGRFEL